ncbi:ankyrin repeat domain-containing protein [Candidatus Riflebacteria bacterium]
MNKSLGSPIEIKCTGCESEFFLYAPFNFSLLLTGIIANGFFGILLGAATAFFCSGMISDIPFYISIFFILFYLFFFFYLADNKLGVSFKSKPQRTFKSKIIQNIIFFITIIFAAIFSCFLFYPDMIRFGVWYIALNQEKPALVRTAISLGFDVNQRIYEDPEKDLGFPIHLAIMFKKENIVRFLVENNAKIDLADVRGDTPLHRLVFFFNNHKIVKFFLTKGAKINIKNKNGQTPLHIAVLEKKDKIIETLVKNRGNPFMFDNKGKTAIDYAREKQMHKVVNYLNRYGKRH